MIRKLLLLFLVTVSLVSCYGIGEKNISAPKLQALLGHKEYDKLHRSNAVTVFKVLPDRENSYVIDSSEIVLDQVMEVELKEIVLNDDHYIFDRSKRCLFIPQYAANFQNDDGDIVVLFGFFCNKIMVISEEKKVIIDNDPSSEKLKQFFKEFNKKFSEKGRSE